MSTATIEREAPAVTSQNLFSIEAEEPLDRRQKMKAKILEEHYQAEIAAALARRLAYVKTGKDKVTIGLQDENGIDIGKLFDFGDRIEVGTGTEAQIEAALDLARAKGWTTLKFNGDAEFKKRAGQMAADAGFEIKGFKSTPKPEPEQGVMDVLAELTGEAPKPATLTPDPHEQARLEARQRVQDALDGPRAGKAPPKLLEVPQADSVDPCLEICRAERQRVQIEIDKVKAELAKVKIHDLATIQKAALAEAQNDAHNDYIMGPVQNAYAKRQEAEAKLKREQKLHAERSWLGKTIHASSLAKLERNATAAKSAHLAAAKIAKVNLLKSDGVCFQLGRAEGDNELHAKLTARAVRLDREAQDLQTIEKRLEKSGEDGKKHLLSVQRGRGLDPAEQRILDLVKRQEQAQRSADQLAEEFARQERQRELNKLQELEEPTADQHETPRPR